MPEQLTTEQVSRIPGFIEKWTKIGLCCEPVDRPRAEAAIDKLYLNCGSEPPSKIIWYNNPLTMCAEHKKKLEIML